MIFDTTFMHLNELGDFPVDAAPAFASVSTQSRSLGFIIEDAFALFDTTFIADTMSAVVCEHPGLGYLFPARDSHRENSVSVFM